MMYILISSFICFIATFFLVPLVIKISFKKNYLVKGGGRNSHDGSVPNIGGAAIFISLILSYFFYFILEKDSFLEVFILNPIRIDHIFSLFICMIIMFFIGFLDDIKMLSLKFRVFVQFVIASFLILYSDIRIFSFFGLFDIFELPYIYSVIFSYLVFIFIINAFNLSDGLDGLASYLGIFILLSFGILFLINSNLNNALIAFTTVSTLVAFLHYNKYPAKIFMGDSGSLLIGLIIAYCAIESCNSPINTSGKYNPVLILCIIGYPSVDTLRVFLIRIFSGKSPFLADRKHLHHVLVDKGFSHTSASLFALLYCVFLSSICLCLDFSVNLSFFVMVMLAIILVTPKCLSFFKFFFVK